MQTTATNLLSTIFIEIIENCRCWPMFRIV